MCGGYLEGWGRSIPEAERKEGPALGDRCLRAEAEECETVGEKGGKLWAKLMER